MTDATDPLRARMARKFTRSSEGQDAMMRRVAERIRWLPAPIVWALVASLLWSILVLGYGIGFLSVAAEAQVRGMVFLDGIFLLLALVFPLGLVWLAAWLFEALREQREIAVALTERTGPLLAELEATRRAVAAGNGGVSDAVDQTIRAIVQTRQRSETDLAETLSAVSSGQVRLQATLTALLDSLVIDPVGSAPPMAEMPPPSEPARPATAPARPSTPSDNRSEEPLLPLLPDSVTDPARPDWPDLVKALDFPRDDQDFEGFRALQAVLRYQPLAQMLQSAEDVLTLLSQEGVYMDDLSVETGDPVHWRRFMAGERGAEVSSVGGIVDEQALELTRALLKSDMIFRDTALFFQRRFDRVLQDFAREAGDEEIMDVANTRSGRAFMLLTRLNGSFD
ncbi:MAG: hypothetical protein KDK03_17060 [Rhodobacteraceae bacterium]|nr:hypothetical protein [Paracoccaceae bacterium]